MASRTLGAIICALFALAFAAPASAAQQRQTGAFALYHGTPKLVSDVSLVGSNELDIAQYAIGSRTPVLHYVRTEGEPLHLILVRDDFRAFSHVHPSYAGNGHYRVRVALDAGHRFYAFVASRPIGDPPQVFRFTLQAGAPPHHVDTSLEAPSRAGNAGPYRISLSADRLPAGMAKSIGVKITRAGRTVSLTPFQGAAAHMMFIDPQSLQYVHVDAHAQDAGRIVLHVPALPRGIYRMWLQFRPGSGILTVPFTLAAQ